MYVLIVVISTLFASPSTVPSIAMHEFATNEACEQAADNIKIKIGSWYHVETLCEYSG